MNPPDPSSRPPDAPADPGPALKPAPLRARAPSVFDDGQPIPAEWDLHCPKCGYNLTGLSERRCPECGERFRPREAWAVNRFGVDREISWPVWCGWAAMVLLAGAGIWVAFYWLPTGLMLLALIPPWLISDMIAYSLDRSPWPGRAVVLLMWIALAALLTFL